MEARDGNRRRHERRRRSRLYIQDEDVQEPRRDMSDTPSPGNRQGHILHHNSYQKNTIRAVTPDSEQVPRPGAPLSISAYNISRSKTSPLSDYQSPDPNSRPATPRSRREDLGHTRTGSKELQVRPRTRTLEERSRDKSPGPLIPRGRNRVGSLQSPSVNDNSSDPPSIGFPSIIPTPIAQPQSYRRHRLAKPLSRPLSPIRNPIAAKPGTSLSSSSTDAKKILQLMKATCGRMHGILSFRTSAISNWVSGYCAINVATGSLIYQTKGEVSLAKTLINDLRGCQVKTLYDPESKSMFLDVSARRSSMGIHLRPHVPEAFDSWLAALLCWQPIRPKGLQNKMTKPQEAQIAERRLGGRKRSSGDPTNKDASIIKVGKMFIWDKDARARMVSPQPDNRRISTHRPLKSTSKNWRRVSCTLQENGHFKVYSDPESSLEAIIPLSQLSRCAVQRLDPSTLDDEFSLAIYPQYTSAPSSLPAMHTIYLSLDSRVLFEVWFVLLRAFTTPELYGPESIPIDSSGSLDPATVSSNPPNTDLFRVERILSLRIIEAKLHPPRQDSSHDPAEHLNAERPQRKGTALSGNYYAEVQLDGEVRARTSIRPNTSNPFFREDFDFSDLPPISSSSTIELKSRNPGQKNWSVARATSELEQGDINPHTIEGDIQISPLDLTYGRVDINLDDLKRATDTEQWWPLLNEQEEAVGELLMKVRIEELVVLMGRDYAPISEMLHSFSNGLTNQITQMAHVELKRLSEILLNIFQVSGHASAWLMSLVEEEIDTIHKETPMSKYRYGRRIASNDIFESSVERELFVRDLGKNATIEANLLFRGNSLLTKALDSHMRRLGKEYLEDTLSEKMRDIEESDPECEVDPNRVTNQDDLQRNWRNLIALTENVWQAIAASATRCPPELRIIMRRIRDCAEDRYGGFLRTVTYSSVSGFLFLRFFCPAVLNPKLFGLLKDHPRLRAQRTLTLITKTLQTLANLNTFGSKEPWMEPMNVFLTTHRPEFKAFVDEICNISSERATSAIPPSYATPITILGRLPGTSKEGFPSLPYLIDQARECASLVDVWLDTRHAIDIGVEWSKELQKFDDLCEASREKSRQCLTRAEQAERPSGTLEPKWEELVEQMERKARFKPDNCHSSCTTASRTRYGSPTVNSSASSLVDSCFYRSPHPSRSSPATSRLATTRSPVSPHSPLSADEPSTDDTGSDTTDTPPGSSSGVGEPGVSPSALENLPPTPSEIDDPELGIQNNSDIVGSSIYSLTPPKSKRDSSATTKTITASTAGSKPSPGHKKGARSAYALRHSSERVDISKAIQKPKSKDGPSAQTSTPYSQGMRSLYRLKADTASQKAVDVGGSTPRSPTEKKDGRGGVFGASLFRKKGREKEREDG
ncbi:MAG: hypothetical protein Q9163_001540 [Psora crenata]